MLLVNTSMWVAHALVAASYEGRAASSADLVAEAGSGEWRPRGATGVEAEAAPMPFSLKQL